MASTSEVILPIGTQKHDPAWKHCLMIRSGGRTKLKCVYCMKLFLGGGIHRIKEHLAKQKGNASRCPKVPPEVQNAMQDSLDGAAVRKKKKLKLAEEVTRVGPANHLSDGNAMDATGIPIVSLPDMLDSGTIEVEIKEEGVLRTVEKGRRRRAKLDVQAAPSLAPPVASDVGLLSKSHLAPVMDKEQVYIAIGRFLFEAGVPLDAVNSAYFQPMVDAIASAGPGLQVPSYHDFRGWILKRSIDELNSTMELYRGTWSRTGCSVLADEWTTDMGKTLINFLVYCPEGMVFLRSVDASHIITSEETLYELLKHVVEQVGERNVVQVVTNNSEVHVLAGKRLSETFPTLFWTPCASRCIDAMLDDISKLDDISMIIENAKSITGFIYNHADVLNMMKRYTNGRDLIVLGEFRAAMNFITLKTMTTLKDELHAMITSEEWADCPFYKRPAGIAMTNLVSSSTFWSSCAMVVRITEPLVRVLNLVDSNRRPTIGYVYVGMYQAKDVIKKELMKKNIYMPYWKIIDWRWNRQLARPLYAAGFFLNPLFFYNLQGQISNEISSGMLDCIERLVPEPKVQDKIQKELNLYKSAAGDFGRKMAVRARHTLLPGERNYVLQVHTNLLAPLSHSLQILVQLFSAEWWSTYGGGCPNLTRLAIRILSQTCSARGCERNHIPFEQIHNQRLNYLEHQRLCDLLFVRYNLRLQQR